MLRLLKTIELENGELYATIGSTRKLLAKCNVNAEIYESVHNISALNQRGYNVRIRHISIVLCSDMEFSREVSIELLKKITGYDLSADIQRNDGVFERLVFNGLIPDDIELGGEWKFEVPQFSEMAKKLLNM